MYKKLKRITLLFTLILSFFISINAFKAYDTKDDAITCTYSNSDTKVTVHITKNGKAKAIYELYDGKDESNALTKEQDVSNINSSNFDPKNSLPWNVWIYQGNKNNTGSKATCPQYLLVGSNMGFCKTHFSDKTSINYNDGCKNNQKVLPLSNSSNIQKMTNPKEPSGLYFTKSDNGTPTFDEANSKGAASGGAVDLEGQKTYVYYVKSSSNAAIKDGGYLSNKMTCSSKNSEVVILESTKMASITYVSYGTVKIKTQAAGTTQLTCSYVKDNGSTVSGFLTINVGSSTKDSYNNKDLSCIYDNLNYENTKLGKVKVVIKDYNDALNKNATAQYYYETSYGHWSNALSSYNEKFTLSGNYTTKFDIKYKDFVNATINMGANGTCPILYPCKSLSTYVLKLTNDCNTTGADADDGFELQGSGCRVDLTNNNVTYGAVTFLKYKKGNTYKYSFVKNNDKSNEKVIGTSINEVKNEYIQNYKDGLMTYMIYATFDKPFLQKVYNNYDTCDFKDTCSNLQASIPGDQYTKNFIFSTDQTICSAAHSEETKGNVGNGKDPSSANNGSVGSNPGNTSELIIVDPGNGEYGEDFCDVIFVGSVKDIVKMLILGIRIAVPVMLILLSMIDFMKAVSDSDKMPTAKKNAITRLIIGVIIFLLPSFIKLIFTLADLPSCASIF